MPRTVISGGAGYVGRFIVEELLSEGHDITIVGRKAYSAGFFSAPVRFVEAHLGQNFDYGKVFDGADYFVHAALDHLPGQFLGGEGADPKGFALKNLAGTAAILKQAKKFGVSRAVFLSDMSVYGNPYSGHHFYEVDEVQPQNLYSKIKHETEKLIEQMSTPAFTAVTIRLAAVYGAAGSGRRHKWEDLFAAYFGGHNIRPFANCQINGEDVGRAISVLLKAEQKRLTGHIFNAMDLVVDRVDILSVLQSATGSDYQLPVRFDREVSTMNCDRLKRLGWRVGGAVKLHMALEKLIAAYVEKH